MKPRHPIFNEEFLERYQFACEEFQSELVENEGWLYRDMLEYAYNKAIGYNIHIMKGTRK